MKKILLLLILAMIALSNFGDSVESLTLDQLKSLPLGKQMEFWNTGHHLLVTSKVAKIDGKEIPIDLVYSHENLTNNPQIRLVAHDDGKEYILWWIDTEGGLMPPSSSEIGCKGDTVGLCFESRPGILLFYEIDIKKTLQSAKSENHKVTPSAWIMPGSLQNTNDNRQMLLLRNVPAANGGGSYIKGMELHCANDQWIFSMVIEGNKTPETKVFYQYPVGGTGLTFLKQEPMPPEPPGVKICWTNMVHIERVKEVWAAMHGKKPGDTVDTNQLFSVFLKGIDLKCPDGGVYDVGAVGEPPKCSVHGVFKQ
jgi:hypothetical protein